MALDDTPNALIGFYPDTLERMFQNVGALRRAAENIELRHTPTEQSQPRRRRLVLIKGGRE